MAWYLGIGRTSRFINISIHLSFFVHQLLVTFKREINIKTLQYKYMQPVGYNLTRSKANCVFTV